MAKKKTVVEMYTEIMAVEGLTDEQREFLAKRRELTENKNAKGASKPTAQQVANEGVKTAILETLANADLPMSVADIGSAVGVDSNQRVTALLTQLKNANQVVRTEVKGKAYYALPMEE